ncbi:MAG: type II toxin-antitoxin system RelE/ParE family toxin [Crocinitomicaceae bacterium]|nr:type II toxin-antitoxin system RelE/ParE family toxin [Crocinitomicaceae bacterium]
MTYALSRRSILDLEKAYLSAYDYYGNIDAADRYEDRMKSEIEWLAQNPEVGKLIQGVREVYMWPFEPYLILYSKSPVEGIQIERILHKRMQLLKYLQ